MSNIGNIGKVTTYKKKIDGLDVECLDIVRSIYYSMQHNYRDWCYNKDRHNEIINLCRANNISGCYRELKDNHGEFMCYEYIPCKYYSAKGTQINKGEWYDINKIPLDYKATIKINTDRILKKSGEKAGSIDMILFKAIQRRVIKKYGHQFLDTITVQDIMNLATDSSTSIFNF